MAERERGEEEVSSVSMSSLTFYNDCCLMRLEDLSQGPFVVAGYLEVTLELLLFGRQLDLAKIRVLQVIGH